MDEERVISALLAGDWADLTLEAGYDPASKPTMTAGFVRRLALGQDPRAPSLPAGVRIRGVRLEGKLDLADCSGSQGGALGVLALEACDLPDRVDVSNTELTRLSIVASRFRELWGEGVQVKGDIDFRGASPLPVAGATTAYIRLRGARVGGDVWGRGAVLKAPDEPPAGLTMIPDALNLWLARIGGSLSLGVSPALADRFRCTGRLNISGAAIGGDLELHGACLMNPAGLALDAVGARMGGDARLNAIGEHRFEAHGEVRMSNADIGGDAVFTGASLTFSEGDTLDLNGSRIGGHLLLMSGPGRRFESEGQIVLGNARITGDLVCRGARLSAKGAVAIGASGIQTGGDALLGVMQSDRLDVEGAIILLNARIGGHLDLNGACLRHPEGDALDLTGSAVGGDIWLVPASGHRFECEGRLMMADMKASGDFICRGARLSNRGGVALSAAAAVIEGEVLLNPHGEDTPCTIEGGVIFNGAVIRGRLDVYGAHMSNPGGLAFGGAGLQTGGPAHFNAVGPQRFEADGEVRLSSAVIGGECNFSGARLHHPEGDALDLTGSRIAGHLLLMIGREQRFEAEGQIVLTSARISGDLNCRGARLSGPGGVALNAYGADIGGEASFSAVESHRFEAEGEVRVAYGRIGGNCDFSGARLSTAGGDAMDAAGSVIGGDVLLTPFEDRRFESEGQIILSNAKLSGDLVCHRARLSNGTGRALSAAAVSVDGALLADDNDIAGQVSFAVAKIDLLGSFTTSAWRGAGRIDLDDISIRQILVDPQHGTAWKQRRDWLRRNSFRDERRRLVVSPHPWRECASAFARTGRHIDARRLQREGYREENRARPVWQQPFVWLFAELPFGFGLSIARTTATVLGFWLIGTAGAEVMYARGVLIDAQTGQAACRSVVPALYALDIAIPFLDLGQEARCDPDDAGQTGLFAGVPAPAPFWSLPATGGAKAPGIRIFSEIALWQWAKAIYALLGSLVVGFAAVTYSGVFKPKE